MVLRDLLVRLETSDPKVSKVHLDHWDLQDSKDRLEQMDLQVMAVHHFFLYRLNLYAVLELRGGDGGFPPTTYHGPRHYNSSTCVIPPSNGDKKWKTICFQCLPPLYFFANSSTAWEHRPPLGKKDTNQ